MKPIALLLLFLLNAFSLFAQSYKELIQTADGQYTQKDYAQSTQNFQKAFKIEQKNPSHLYNGACAAALAGKKKLALKWLDAAQKNGWSNVRHARQDSDLNSLHGNKQFEKILGNMQAETDKLEANYDKPLRDTLLAILDRDQKWRQQLKEVEKNHGHDSEEMQALWKTISYHDSINLLKISAILDEKGWVGPDKIGGQANQALFLVIQHSNLVTQQKYLPMMREAVKNKNASGSSLALLEDRVALGEGRKQVYGSQIGRNKESGKYYVLPLEDPDHVDERRAAVGLGPLADYVMRWEIKWDVAAYKQWLEKQDRP